MASSLEIFFVMKISEHSVQTLDGTAHYSDNSKVKYSNPSFPQFEITK